MLTSPHHLPLLSQVVQLQLLVLYRPVVLLQRLSQMYELEQQHEVPPLLALKISDVLERRSHHQDSIGPRNASTIVGIRDCLAFCI